jgi:hypothetical protein
MKSEYNTQTRFAHCQAVARLSPKIAVVRARLDITEDPAARVEADAYLEAAVEQIASLDDPRAANRIMDFVGRAKEALDRPTPRQPEPESEEVQQRRRELRRPSTRERKLYQTAIHEAGHCLGCHLNGVRIDHALVRRDLSGEVLHYSEPDRQAIREIAIAGECAVSAFGFTPHGLDDDHNRLRSGGHLRPDRADELRRHVEQDVLAHRTFVSAVADELYVHCGQDVPGDRIAELWATCRS